jgi:hypothetical protein
MIPIKIVKKLLNDSVANTYTSIKLLGNLSDYLKKITLSYVYGEGNSNAIYDYIYGLNDGEQEELIDFLYEVFYCIQSYGYSEEYFRKLEASLSKYVATSHLSNQIKEMAKSNKQEVEDTDILFGVTVFLRLFLRQFDSELIKRNNQEQKTNFNQER